MTPTEIHAARELRKAGWRVLHCGWPDFLCVREMFGEFEVAAVEVKRANDKVRHSQRTMHNALLRAGVKTFIYRCDAPELPPESLSFRFTEDDIRLIVDLREKLNITVSEVVRLAICALAEKEGVRG